MEFNTLGKHCSYSSCHQLDFLPFTCDHCTHSYCLQHRLPDQHECTAIHNKQQTSNALPPPSSTIKPIKYKCTFCKHSEITPISCRNCGLNYCIKHRLPTSHQCESLAILGANRILPAGAVSAQPLIIGSDSIAISSSASSSISSTIPVRMSTGGITLQQQQTRKQTNIANVSKLLKSQA